MRYLGGKFRIAPWIISFFPRHEVYCEPFGGSASVFMAKEKCRTEVYNDINSDLYNLFVVLRDKDKSVELSRRLYFSPWSREDFYNSYTEDDKDDDIEKARKLIVKAYMSCGTTCTRKSRSGFRSTIASDYIFEDAKSWEKYYRYITDFSERLRTVIIENTKAHKVISIYDTDKTLHYIDPPYVLETWSKSDANCYKAVLNQEGHIELLKLIKGLKGYVVLSGYESDLYNDLLQDWHKESKATINQKYKPKKDTIWISPRTWDSIQRQKGLFE